MGEIFTFVGLVVHDYKVMIAVHILIVGIGILILAKLATRSMQLVPRGVQNVMEAYLEGVIHIGKDVIGRELARKYLPLVATIGIFVFFCNIFGVFPGFYSPTSNISLTIILAVTVFIYYNYEGIRVNGIIKYLAHFMGPVKILAPIMFPIEVVSHLSRVVSLSFRLFGVIKGDDMFLIIMLGLAPFIAPLVPFTLLTFMSFLQAFIFMILTYVYLAGAVLASEH